MHRIIASLLTALFCLCLAMPAQAEKRIALVVGNAAYTKVSPLANPVNDAELVGRTLKKVGFDVVLATDVDVRAMARAIRTFGKKLRQGGKDAVGLFYYAGHGVQARGTNYLIPIGALIDDHADLAIEAVSASDILQQMESAGNRLNLVVLDACRNNPFRGRLRSGQRGLTRVEAASGSLIAFAAAPGQAALDGEGGNSPYTSALAEAMLLPGLTVEQAFKQVRLDVEARTGERQTPWEESSLKGDFYFVPPSNEAAAAATPQTLKTQSSSIELEYWLSIKSSRNADMFKAYLRQFPGGSFSSLARIRLAELSTDAGNDKGGDQGAPTSGENQSGHSAVASLDDNQTGIAPEPKQTGEWSDPKALVRAIQSELDKQRCNPGPVDGSWGRKSRRAVEKFAKYANLAVSAEPSPDLLGKVRSKPGPVCPLECGARYRAKDNKCVLKTCKKGEKLSRKGKCLNQAALEKSCLAKCSASIEKQMKSCEANAKGNQQALLGCDQGADAAWTGCSIECKR